MRNQSTKARKPNKSVISLLMAVFLLFGVVLQAAALNEDAADGTVGYDPEAADDSRVGEDRMNIMEIDPYTTGVSDHWYCIDDAEGLLRFAELINTYQNWSGMKVYLGKNIDMTGVAFSEVIGKGATRYSFGIPQSLFDGTFDGCGYQIDGLTVSTSPNANNTMSYASLFGVLGNQAVVRNLVLGPNCRFTATAEGPYVCTAALASRVIEGATIENVLSMATVSGGYYAAGLIARLDNNNRESAISSTTISNCSNAGNVSGIFAVGGLVGSVRGSASLIHCKNSGDLYMEGEAAGSMIGGLVGTAEMGICYTQLNESGLEDRKLKIALNLQNCRNLGNIQGGAAAGGCLGRVNNSDVEIVSVNLSKCVHAGSIANAAQMGAFAGNSVNALTLTGCSDASGAVRGHGSQVRTSNTEADRFSVRFVGSIADLSYQEIGFVITVKQGERQAEKTLPCWTVFSTMTAGEDQIVYTAEGMRGTENGYLYAVTIEDIPMSVGLVEFTVTPYGIRSEGAEPEYGERFTAVYANGIYQPAWEKGDEQ